MNIQINITELKLILESLQATTLELRPIADKVNSKYLLERLLNYDILRIKLESLERNK